MDRKKRDTIERAVCDPISRSSVCIRTTAAPLATGWSNRRPTSAARPNTATMVSTSRPRASGSGKSRKVRSKAAILSPGEANMSALRDAINP